MNEYYVYELAYPSSMGGTVFYVGKGKAWRMYQHVCEAKQGVASRKCNVIREVLSKGEEIQYRKIAEGLSEGEALALEIQRIDAYGLHALTNERRGGGGPVTLEVALGERGRYERLSISFSADVLDSIQRRAKLNDRSINKEVILMLRTLLQKEEGV